MKNKFWDFSFLISSFKQTIGTYQVALAVKNSPANAGGTRDAGSVPGLGRSPEEGNSSPLQYSCLEDLMDRGNWKGTVHGVPRVGHH